MKRLGLLLIALAAIGCTQQTKEINPADWYTIQADEIVTRGGGTNYAAILITPAEGKAWNSDYQAKARVTNPDGLVPEALRFDNAAFKATGGQTRLNVPVSTTTAGSYKLEMALDFSMCFMDKCHDFEDVPVTIQFTVN